MENGSCCNFLRKKFSEKTKRFSVWNACVVCCGPSRTPFLLFPFRQSCSTKISFGFRSQISRYLHGLPLFQCLNLHRRRVAQSMKIRLKVSIRRPFEESERRFVKARALFQTRALALRRSSKRQHLPFTLRWYNLLNQFVWLSQFKAERCCVWLTNSTIPYQRMATLHNVRQRLKR